FLGGAGKLAADGDLVGRLQVAGGGDAQEDVAAPQGRGFEDRAVVLREAGVAVRVPGAARRQDGDADPQPALEMAGFALADEGGEVFAGFGGFHEWGCERITSRRQG